MTELRSPPSVPDAEAAVIGTFMFYEQDRAKLLATVKADHFYDPRHETLWRLMGVMAEAGEPIEVTSVGMFADNAGQLDDIGGVEHLAKITELTTSTPAFYAKQIERAWLLRTLINVGRDLIESAYQPEVDTDQLIAKTTDAIIEIQSGRNSCEVSLADSIRLTLADLDARRDEPAGLSTGFDELDQMLGGMRNSQLIVLGSRPSMGKSALALSIAKHASAGGHAAMYITLEMNHGEQTERLLSSEASVDSSLFLSGQLDEKQSQDVAAAARSIAGEPLFYLDSVFESEAILASIRAAHRKHKLKLVIVDYLQLCEVNGIGEQYREKAVAKLSRAFKRLAQQLAIPVMVLSQLNREVEKRQSKRPMLSDLRESGAIEQDANVVLLLHRPDWYDSEDQPGVAEVIVAKNRSGGKGIVRLKFVKELTRFESQPPLAPPDVYGGAM